MPSETERKSRVSRFRFPFRNIGSAKLASLSMLIIGIVLLVVSSVWPSLVFALIGLSLTFWGALLLYVRPSRYVKHELLTASFESLAAIDELIERTGFKGKAIYLPPKYLQDNESSILMISKNQTIQLPTSEVGEDDLLNKRSAWLFLTPPGISLSKLFEQTLGSSFTKLNLQQLEEKLSTIFVKELEISDSFTMQREANQLTINLAKSAFAESCSASSSLSSIHNSVGCAFCSALACALAKASGKPIMIEKEEQNPREQTTTIVYHVLEEQETPNTEVLGESDH